MVLALVQLLAAERLEQTALSDLEVDAAISGKLAVARERYLAVLLSIQELQNALAEFQVAGTYWGFGCYPRERVVRLGPFEISVPTASSAAVELARSIHTAAIEVDRCIDERYR